MTMKLSPSKRGEAPGRPSFCTMSTRKIIFDLCILPIAILVSLCYTIIVKGREIDDKKPQMINETARGAMRKLAVWLKKFFKEI